MTRPESFIVFGEIISVEYVKGLDSYGVYDRQHKTIQIRDCLTGDELTCTLIHELGHAIEDRLSFLQAIDEGVFEIVNDNYAKCLVENFTIIYNK